MPSLTFSQLEMELSKRDSGGYSLAFRFRACGSDADNRTDRFPFDLDRTGLKELFEKIGTGEAQIGAYGKSLTKQVFSNEQAFQKWSDYFASAQRLNSPLRIQLTVSENAPELHEIVWETLCNPENDQMLTTDENIWFSRYLPSQDRRPVQPGRLEDLQVVAAAANPNNLVDYKFAPVDVDGEIERACRPFDVVKPLILPRGNRKVTLQNLLDEIRSGAEVVYLACHGYLVDGKPMLVLEDDQGKLSRINGKEFVDEIKKLARLPRLMVFASCESAGKQHAGALSALGPMLTQAGVPAVLAMQGKINMATVEIFTPAFFREVQRDGQIDRALSVARNAIRNRCDIWLPVLFLRSESGRLWESIQQKKTGSLLDNLTQPIPIQILQAVAMPEVSTDKEALLEALRAVDMPLDRAEAIAWTEKIIGGKSIEFWKQVDARQTDVLMMLAQNALMLEGLILVFEQGKGSFPKNDGKLLSMILATQFSAKKLNLKKIVSLDVFQTNLGKLLAYDYPAMRLPKDYDGHIDSPYNDYERLIEDVGESHFSDRRSLGGVLLVWILGFFHKTPELFFASIERLPVFWRTIFYIPILLMINPLGFLLSVIIFPFSWIERKIGDYASDYNESSKIQRAVSLLWEKYRDFKRHARRFFDKFNLRRVRAVHRGELIILCAKQAGIIKTEGKKITFLNEFWRDYFTSFYLVKYNAYPHFFNRRYSKSWHEIHEGENVGVMMCGLHPEPTPLVKYFSVLDPVVATDCFASMESSDQAKNQDLRDKILSLLANKLKQLPDDGNGPACNQIIRSFRKLTDNPFYAHLALEKLPSIYGDESKIEAARNIATFGATVYDMLVDHLNRAEDSRKKHYLIALGELGDARAVLVLQNLFKDATDPLVKVWAVVILATYFADSEGMAALEKLMRYDVETNAEHKMCDCTWKDVDFNQTGYISFALGVLERASDGSAKRMWNGYPHDPWSHMEGRFVDKVSWHYKDNHDVEKLLFEHLEKSNRPRFTILLVRALGGMKSKPAIPKLLDFINQDDVTLRYYTIKSLGEIGDERATTALIGFLFLSNLTLVMEAIEALGKIKDTKAIPALIEKLQSDEILLDEYSHHQGASIAYFAMQALVIIGNHRPEGKNLWTTPKERADIRALRRQALKAATRWCYIHRESDFRVNNGTTTLGKRCKEYLEYEIDYRVARRLFYALAKNSQSE